MPHGGQGGAPHGPATLLGLACGVCYGVTAFLFELLSGGHGGFVGLLERWPLWAVIVIGPLGFLLNQSAYQAGVMVSPVLSVITAADPLVSSRSRTSCCTSSCPAGR